MEVCVTGAGVIGMTTAVAIQDRLPNVRVTIVADKFGRHTNSYGSAGIVLPKASQLPEDIRQRCCRDSAEYFYDLGFSCESRDSGVSVVNGFILTNGDKPPPTTEFLYNVHQVEPRLMEKFDTKRFKNAYTAVTTVVDLPVYLKWLMDKFQSRGGRVVKKFVNSLEELADQYQVVVNCSGVGSSQLANDPLVHPVRGQTLHVHAPWIKTLVHTDENIGIVPFANSVFVGGVKQSRCTDMNISEKDGQFSLAACTEIFAPLQGAKVMWEWVGMRPGRRIARVEREIIQREGRPLKVIHNYGHESVGVSLSWGCAVYVTELVKECLDHQPRSKL